VLFVSCATRDDKGFGFPQSGDLIDSSFFFPQQFKKDYKDSIVLTTTSEYFKKIGLTNLSISPALKEVYRFTYIRAFDEPVVVLVYKDSIITIKDYSGLDTVFDYDDSKLSKEESRIREIWGNYKFNTILLDRHLPDSVVIKKPSLAKAIEKQKKFRDSIFSICPLIADTVYINKLIDKTQKRRIVQHYSIRNRITINESDFKNIKETLDKYGFWTIRNTNNLFVGTDGSEWILEVNNIDTYNFVYAWEPEGNFRLLCMELLKYANLKEKEIY
jgi:hypothetical protein